MWQKDVEDGRKHTYELTGDNDDATTSDSDGSGKTAVGNARSDRGKVDMPGPDHWLLLRIAGPLVRSTVFIAFFWLLFGMQHASIAYDMLHE